MESVKQNPVCDKEASFGEALLQWYDTNARVLPWRYRSGEMPDPYRVWLSEIMLQQTTVTAVIPYFQNFIERWPDVHALASAEPETLMAAWAGLGYYARARNLLACARVISSEFEGVFPEDERDLKNLPGIGTYTSAAISAIAFNRPAVVVDGNVERVLARVHPHAVQNVKDKRALRELAVPYYRYAENVGRPGDMAQGFMDLGAGICIPRNPRCGLCPVAAFCSFAAMSAEERASVLLPKKAQKKHRKGHVYWIEDGHGRVLLHRRRTKGLLGGMVGLPTSEWVEDGMGALQAPAFLEGLDLRAEAKIGHVFTHFVLELQLYVVEGSLFSVPETYFWHPISDINGVGLPSLFAKVVSLRI